MKFATAFAIPVAVCLLLGAANTLSAQGTGDETAKPPSRKDKLEFVVIVSRHGVRSPTASPAN